MSLNQQMQAQWAVSRKINLNTTLEVPVAPTPVAGKKRKPSSIAEEAPQKKSKNAAAKDYTPPATRLSDLGGVQPCVEKMLELVAMPLKHPEIYIHTGVQPPRGVLLHGPPGCGKTLLANAIAGELQVPFISISAPSVVSGMSGESEKTIRDTFEEAKNHAPCLLFIDEIDAITPKRENAQREMERRIVAQLLTCMDDLSWEKTDNKPVMVIGATNRPDALDSALRRAGRFDHEISMNVPDEDQRAHILRVQCSKLRLEGGFDYQNLAKQTPGYVGADLAALASAAGVIAVKRIFQTLSSKVPPDSLTSTDGDETMLVDEKEDGISKAEPSSIKNPIAEPIVSPASIAQFLLAHPSPLTETELEPLVITYDDFLAALPTIQPSVKREGFTTIPEVTWDDVGGAHEIRSELHISITQPILNPALFKAAGITAPSGVLLWGPPGCGKTHLAKAVANESQANFISVKGPELLNKYVGESERAVRQVFARARASTPCIVFFDELDALVPRRDESMSEATTRVVNTLLSELDGLESRNGIYVIGATNRPDMIDPAMCRPGRLDKLLFVDIPRSVDRSDIIKACLRKLPFTQDTAEQQKVWELVASERCEGYSGADLAMLAKESAIVALRRKLVDLKLMGTSDSKVEPQENTTITISAEDVSAACSRVFPSVSPMQRRKYESLRTKLSGGVPTVRVPDA